MHTIALKPEVLITILGINLTNTLLTSFVVVIAIAILTILISLNLKLHNPGKLQLALEMTYEGLGNLFKETTHKEYSNSWLFSILFTLFIYILFSNWFGVLPINGTLGIYDESHHELIYLFRTPTSDLSITAGLALLSVFLANFLGLKTLKLDFLSRYINLRNPIDFFVGILELISEVGKIISFSFRLFGNVFAGKVLLLVVTYLTLGIATLPVMGLELFVGAIQAFVFFILTCVFIGLAVSKH